MVIEVLLGLCYLKLSKHIAALTPFSKWYEMHPNWFEFNWNMFQLDQLAIRQYWLRKWVGTNYLKQWWQTVLKKIYVPRSWWFSATKNAYICILCRLWRKKHMFIITRYLVAVKSDEAITTLTYWRKTCNPPPLGNQQWTSFISTALLYQRWSNPEEYQCTNRKHS